MKQKYCTSHCVSWSPGTYYHKSWNHPLALKVPLEPCLVLAPGFSEKVVSGSTGSPCPVYDNIPCPSISQVHSMGLVYLPIYIWLIFIVNLLVNVLYIECLGMCWTVELPVPAFFLRMFSEFLRTDVGPTITFANHLMDDLIHFETLIRAGHSWPNLSNISSDEHWNEIATLHEYNMDINHDGLQKVP